MGWKIKEKYQNNPAQDREEYNTTTVEVRGDSISDCVTIEEEGNRITLEISVLSQILNDLARKGAL